jgi:hypothetical protein
MTASLPSNAARRLANLRKDHNLFAGSPLFFTIKEHANAALISP